MNLRQRMLTLLAPGLLTVLRAPALAAQDRPDELVMDLTLRCTSTAAGRDKVYDDDIMSPPPYRKAETQDSITVTYRGQRRWKVEPACETYSGIMDDLGGSGVYSVSGGGHYSSESKRWIGGKTDVYIMVDTRQASWTHSLNKPKDTAVPVTLGRETGSLKAGFTIEFSLDDYIVANAVKTVGKYHSWGWRRGSTTRDIRNRETSAHSGVCSGNRSDPDWKKPFTVTIDRNKKSLLIQRHATLKYEHATGLVGKDAAVDQALKIRATTEVDFTLRLNHSPDAEAFIVPYEDYKQWLPAAGANETVGGNRLTARIVVEPKDKNSGKQPKGKVRALLSDTSKVPGVCCNRPPKEQAQDTRDLKIEPQFNEDWDVDEDGQAATSKKSVDDIDLTVTSFDFGASGRLQAHVEIDGGASVQASVRGLANEQAELSMPLDDNHNYVADAWEEQKGIRGANYPAEWDESDDPAGQKAKGDGIGLYEKYRGFYFRTGPGKREHQRLNPKRKHLFIHDADQLMATYAAAGPLAAASNLELVFIDACDWTGRGSSSGDKRIVNFNKAPWGHAVDQHGLDIASRQAGSPYPPGWEKLMKQRQLPSGFSEDDPRVVPTAHTFTDGCFTMGPPVNVFQIAIFPDRMASIVKMRAKRCLYQAAPYAASRARDDDSWKKNKTEPGWDDSQAALDLALAHYDAAHAGEFKQAVDQMTRVALVHEVGHGVGVHHHEPEPDDGDKKCYIKYFKYGETPPNPDDPYYLKAQAPSVFCRGTLYTHGGRGCYTQIVVNDLEPGEGQ